MAKDIINGITDTIHWMCILVLIKCGHLCLTAIVKKSDNGSNGLLLRVEVSLISIYL